MIRALLLTILVSVFFLLGMIIPWFVKNKNKLIQIATGFTFLIILYLIFLDLLPEIIEIYDPFHHTRYILLILLFVALGAFLLKVLDLFVPEHTHKHQEDETNVEEHKNHFYHIGLITSITIIIHNFLEGISIYVTGMNNFSAGLLMAITVGLHNLPLGIEIAVHMNATEKNRGAKKIISLFLILSSFLGALILYSFHTTFNAFIEGILLSITMGMLFYICFFELFLEIKENRNRKEIKIGLLVGGIFAILMALL